MKGSQAPVAYWIRDNLEVLLLAFLLALIVGCFFVDVYKIPTGSMEPTLMGNPLVNDRIMVNKLSTEFLPIGRYEVGVFRFPLDRSLTYVKRVVGLPGETLRFEGGDLYVRSAEESSFRIARKPLRVQQRIWIPVTGTDFLGEAEHPLDLWTAPAESCFLRDEGTGRWVFDSSGAPEPRSCRFSTLPGWRVRDSHRIEGREQWGAQPVYDIRLSFHWQAAPASSVGVGPAAEPSGDPATPLGAGVFAEILKGESEGYFRVSLRAEGRVEVREESGEQPPNPERAKRVEGSNALIPIAPGLPSKSSGRSEQRVEILHYDGALAVFVDNDLVYENAYRAASRQGRATEAHRTNAQVSLGTSGVAARFWDIRLERDLYYDFDRGENSSSFLVRTGGEVVVPEGKYFVVGDNVGQSRDSRSWKRARLRLANGKVLEGDAEWERGSNPRKWGDVVRFRDAFGMVHEFARSAGMEELGAEESPFVESGDFLGTGFLVFYPFGRWKRIH